ncbi:MAG: efflux transporter outer membrane subunit [Bacteroidales bacterium]|nr:efflux transporter outer membrane subunit [Bacteroidales bacterium]
MRTYKSIITILIFLVLFFSGCMVGPRYQKPETYSPEAYRFGEANPDSAYNIRWWELFNDPVLDTLITTALENNTDVRIAVSRVEQARASLGYTKADQFPKIGYEAGASRGNFAGGQQFSSETNAFYGVANLQWEIDFWGKYRSAGNAARAGLLASEYAHRAVQVAIISEVANVYFQLLDYKERLEIAKSTLLTREGSLDIIRQRFNKGVVAEIDLNQAQIQRAIAAGAVPQYERAVAQTENTLQFLLGKNPGIIETGAPLLSQEAPPEIPAGIPSTLLLRRPDILQTEQTLIAQNAQVGVAQAMRFPSISITGLLGVASNDLSTLTSGGAAWSVGGSLLGPIFNFGKNKRRVELEMKRTEEALIQYEAVVIQAFREVEDALIEINTYRRQLEIKQQEFEAAYNANTLSRDRYNGGVTSYLEVLESERTLFSVELDLSQTRQQYLASYIKLYNALGGGWISPEEEQQTIQK